MSEKHHSSHKKKRKKLAYWYWGIALLLLLIAILIWLLFWRFRAYTDDAYVEGNQVNITPLRPGFVTSIHTDDTYLVKKGQLLIELDKSDSIIALDQAREELASTTREVCQLFHDVFALESEIEMKKADLIRAGQDYQHRGDVLSAEGVSLEDYEHSVASLRSYFYSLQMTETLYERALAMVQGTTIRDHPLVQAAADRLRNAWLQLYRCNIYSPVEGLAAQRTIQVGTWVKAGDPMLSVIPLDQIWVNANYKETQLKHMRLGQSVKITSDLYGGGVVYHGRIAGLPGGAGNAFSLLPPENLSGNWIKIVQRLPVRVELDPDEICAYPLRIGLSMEATVNLEDTQGGLVPLSNEGSPIYETSIYQKEELGDDEAIIGIISENLDPTLLHYFEKPLVRNTSSRFTKDERDMIQHLPLQSKWSDLNDLNGNISYPGDLKNWMKGIKNQKFQSKESEPNGSMNYPGNYPGDYLESYTGDQKACEDLP